MARRGRACRAIASGRRRASWRRTAAAMPFALHDRRARSRTTIRAACRSRARSRATAISARSSTAPPRSTTSRWRTAARCSRRSRRSIRGFGDRRIQHRRSARIRKRSRRTPPRYRALRDLWNAGARFVSPMAWNGSNGSSRASRATSTFTAWRNTPLEDAARDFLLARAGLAARRAAVDVRHAARTPTATAGRPTPARLTLAPGALTLVRRLREARVDAALRRADLPLRAGATSARFVVGRASRDAGIARDRDRYARGADATRVGRRIVAMARGARDRHGSTPGASLRRDRARARRAPVDQLEVELRVRAHTTRITLTRIAVLMRRTARDRTRPARGAKLSARRSCIRRTRGRASGARIPGTARRSCAARSAVRACSRWRSCVTSCLRRSTTSIRCQPNGVRTGAETSSILSLSIAARNRARCRPARSSRDRRPWRSTRPRS